jgi:hypothetical protein
MSIAGILSIRRLKDVAIVMDLHELAPVGGRATSGRHRWRLERFATMHEDFPDRSPDRGQSLQCKGRPRTVPQQVLQALKVARHVAVYCARSARKASMENPLFSQASMSAAAEASSR